MTLGLALRLIQEKSLCNALVSNKPLQVIFADVGIVLFVSCSLLFS